MSTRATIERLSQRTGWDNDTVLDLLIAYIDNQDSPAALEDFLTQQADEEAPVCGRCGALLEDPFGDPWCPTLACTDPDADEITPGNLNR